MLEDAEFETAHEFIDEVRANAEECTKLSIFDLGGCGPPICYVAIRKRGPTRARPRVRGQVRRAGVGRGRAARRRPSALWV